MSDEKPVTLLEKLLHHQQFHSRRDFLKTCLAIASSSLLFDETHAAQKKKAAGNEADVLVLGAGMAGITAARALQNGGMRVLVLEGRDRIGGRIHTDRRMKNLALDMGASWIQGTTNNPITAIARDNNIRTIETDYDTQEIYDSNGQELTARDERRLERREEQLSSAIEAAQESSPRDTTLKQALDRILAEAGISEAEKAQVNYIVSSVIENEYAADVSDLSLYHWDQDGGFAGGSNVFPNGYDQITNLLAKGLDIRLQHIASRVEYNQNGVSITTDKGVFTGRQAVVTLPLGVLKRGVVTFAPLLPEAKLSAIKRLNMGILNKVYLRFPKVFWSQEAHGIGYIDAEKGRWNEWYNYHKYLGEPVLAALVAGIHAQRIETMTDKAVVADAMTVVRKIYGSSVPEPLEWLITRWGQDPFAFGSYSHIPLGGKGRDYDTLAEPVGNRLFFAGEATHREYPATVHGAYLSGEREAKRMLGSS